MLPAAVMRRAQSAPRETTSLSVSDILSYDDEIVRVATVDHRPKRRIARIAAVPIGLTVDLDRLKKLRQARRCDEYVHGHCGIGDHARQTGSDVGQRDVERRR